MGNVNGRAPRGSWKNLVEAPLKEYLIPATVGTLLQVKAFYLNQRSDAASL
jgi:hypothetical protein